MIILVTSGKQGSGKTTLTDKLERAIMNDALNPYHFEKLKFADPLYEMHGAIRDILKRYNYANYDYSKKDGPLLQMLGTEWGRKIDENIWVNLLLNRLKDLYDNSIVSIDDCRFENEFDAFNGMPNVLRVRLEADTETRKARCSMWRPNDNHPSEVGLDNYVAQNKFDMVLDAVNRSEDEIFNIVLNKIYEMQSKEIADVRR